ncbi:MAG: UDP-N-acetylmuramoyl-L-alanine--D-glutamate ligase [Gilliamella sp.]|uniref:UDP-N-acetylmuramoyl-L-alanine--D-glutamate ligase n=1 Tax=Gilliamella TaxID=1193503 RepID=UPI00080E47CB|nr:MULTISPECIES: UDP-N-acetylmuramoyl-L-alanine--D-glutamate ligase [Gilliamella]MCO6538621.1 UDP-N-acetylmuramoyl-L-alanine--D-glutamate ligase [Gilliamella sp.]MCO6553387.1 UDP-N-acetylmuramoyl-L-alanine--D-glutamate ligase [Gilliamella sp.]MCO6555694.1 UDP-N-acetylmuramoyl-L-alanine--D-glutamate ligase [Gilliamella sp.]NUE95877.1 UDP-N-acetylmuramoyl-L-alanine--D-glutamate ligase [Gilliamella sp. ESL0232]OCG37112.1 UDP-N-acetylmuramoyl-L-alanine--D-glutamate ligase [Gilliamella apicola]
MVSYQGKNVVIIGLGVTGLSCVDYFLAQNVIPKVIDTRKSPSGMEQLDKRVACHLGELNVDWLLDADLIIVSPGIALSTPELQQAAKKGIEIIGDIELFCRELNQQNSKQIVAITGANGKTTVTTLVGEIIKSAGIKVAIGGNIGQPALSLLNQHYDVYVLELSSFQLETTQSLKATVATILNISEDHMDRYPLGLMQYVEAKQRIYHNAKYCVINHDDKLTIPTDQQKNCVSFGVNKGDYHLDFHFEHLIAQEQPVVATKIMKLAGCHNYLNALAALAIVDKLKISRESSIATIISFHGLAHRFELVLEKNGVKWINDSKATNVGSTEAALNSVVCKGKLFLLLGGDGKSADFSPLIPFFENRNLEIFCFGRDRFILAKLAPHITTVTETLSDAMQVIAQKVEPNDVVLLSPACASLDQFKNYIERGKQFAQLAEQYTQRSTK